MSAAPEPTPSKPSAPGKPRGAATSPPRQAGAGRGESPASQPTTVGPSDAGDGAAPEIAAAARPRGRAKKAAAPDPVRRGPDPGKDSPSTVTPPPSSPTVAQINPKPPAD
jgi:hypothetical protein